MSRSESEEILGQKTHRLSFEKWCLLWLWLLWPFQQTVRSVQNVNMRHGAPRTKAPSQSFLEMGRGCTHRHPGYAKIKVSNTFVIGSNSQDNNLQEQSKWDSDKKVTEVTSVIRKTSHPVVSRIHSNSKIHFWRALEKNKATNTMQKILLNQW